MYHRNLSVVNRAVEHRLTRSETGGGAESVMSSAEAFNGARVIATDGMMGRVVDLLFDEDRWTVRYLVVNAGDSLPRSEILISPYSVRYVDMGARVIVSSVTRNAAARSQRARADKRQRGWGLAEVSRLPLPSAAEVGLHSFRSVSGFLVRGAAEALGRVDDLLFDEGSWVIRHIVIAAGRWLEGRRFEIAPERLHRVSWDDRCFILGVRRADIRRKCCGSRAERSLPSMSPK
jgi:hypothetical protein